MNTDATLEYSLPVMAWHIANAKLVNRTDKNVCNWRIYCRNNLNIERASNEDSFGPNSGSFLGLFLTALKCISF